MKAEARLFAGVAAFFLVTGGGYGWWSREPAGTAALVVAFLMSTLLSFFFDRTYRRRGLRPEDRGEGEVADRSGPLDFFPPHSPYPPVTGLGAVATALGVVFGLWLFVLGLGLLLAGVFGLVFEFVQREE
ncbi:cytochrome c oxidase subunit 4 [Streptomyces sp. NPDC058045]|uniref:aa3-type cytochrome oxidase subunit IV n=1 Tax=Streptomyces sp. NPDC058045 TaxID=3346311 RepID=UPI0036F13FA6